VIPSAPVRPARRSGAAAGLATLVAFVVVLVANTATGVLTARLLGPGGRGSLAALLFWPQFLAMAATLGLPTGLVYTLNRLPTLAPGLVFAALAVGGLVGVAAAAVGLGIIPVALDQYPPEVRTWACWCLLNTPVSLLTLVGIAAAEAEGDFAVANRVRTFTPLATLLGLIALAGCGLLTPASAALAYLLPGLPVLVLLLLYLLRRWWPRPQAAAVPPLARYSLRAWGSDLLGTLGLQVDQLFVIGLLAPAAMGIYAAAASLARLLNVFQNAAVRVLFARAAARTGTEVVALTGRTARVSFALTVAGGMLVIGLGPALIASFYGAAYREAATVFPLLVAEVVLGSTAAILGQAYLALGRPEGVAFAQALGLGVGVPLLCALVPAWGLTGAGCALLVGAAVRLACLWFAFHGHLGVPPPSLRPRVADWQKIADWRNPHEHRSG
jgi:O-antigen/teichoic acid export membrane protein